MSEYTIFGGYVKAKRLDPEAEVGYFTYLQPALIIGKKDETAAAEQALREAMKQGLSPEDGYIDHQCKLVALDDVDTPQWHVDIQNLEGLDIQWGNQV